MSPHRDTPDAAQQAANVAASQAARSSYGRLLAYLAYRWRDIAAAEDALADAFASALQSWPVSGIPDAPDAWLMTAAKRNLLQMARRAKLASSPAITILLGETEEAMPAAKLIPDDRLKLLFVCAHPAIEPAMRTALMLQTVLGLDAKQVASAFLVSPTAMAQRLVRVKNKIAQQGIRFEEPEAKDLPDRIHAVLEAIYAAYSLGCDGIGADQLGTHATGDMVSEALYLADLTASLLPQSAEAKGLLALMVLCEARRPARLGPQGEFVPLHQQDCNAWDKTMIEQADQLLSQAAALHQPGPFQLEAAIQAAHSERLFTQVVPWAGIAQLYNQLSQLAPTTGAQVSRGVAIGEALNAQAGLDALSQIPSDSVQNYQPFWVAQAYLLAKQAKSVEAQASYQRALGLTTRQDVRAYLQLQIQALLNKELLAPVFIGQKPYLTPKNALKQTSLRVFEAK
jgi:RNA polymerase sigma-70 factor, ECF subfamily